MKRNKIKHIFLLLILLAGLILCGCDTERNEILVGLFSSPTPTATEVPPTATPTVTPSPTPTLTPTPVYFSLDYYQYIQFGDYDRASSGLTPLFDADLPNDDAARAGLGLARIAYAQGRQEACREYLDTAEKMTTDPDILYAAAYLRAQSFRSDSDRQEEAKALQRCLSFRETEPIREDLWAELAAAYDALGDRELARSYYEQILMTFPEDDNDAYRLEIAKTYMSDKSWEAAEELLLELSEKSVKEWVRVDAEYLLGLVYQSMGVPDRTAARFTNLVNMEPTYYDSYLALVWLLEDDQPVNDFQRGLVDYYAGQYAKAAEAFYRYIKTEPGHDGTAWYFIGLCRMYMANYNEAETAFRTLVDKYPTNRYYVSSWDELSYVQWVYQSKHRKAADTLLEYVSLHPDQADSANFLFEAGRILERGNYLKDAAAVWSRLIDEYPLYENSKNALFNAAIACYRSGEYETALASLNRLQTLSAIPYDQSRAHFWIAKIYEKKGDNYNYRKYLLQASNDAPYEYYTFRAQEILDGNPDPLTLSGKTNFSYNLDEEKQIADQWMLLNFPLSGEQPIDYRSDPLYQKGVLYYQLAEYEKALFCFEDVRTRLENDAVASYDFLSDMLEMNMYNTASYTARQILTAAGLIENSRTMEVPNYFNHIRYGTWYAEYVTQAANDYDIPVFLLFAVMRQESMFDPWVTSSAGARGLMQIMPETGEEIAGLLKWPAGYDVTDLNRVPVALRFGASYFSRMYKYFDENKIPMLASYNAGAGNVYKWYELAKDDPDLFTEIIRFSETRDYVRNIYEFAKVYEKLYSF